MTNYKITAEGFDQIVNDLGGKVKITGDALWLQLSKHPSLDKITHEQFALLFQILAKHIEYRGQHHLDLDPGETSDWLHQEAARAWFQDLPN